MKNNNILKEHKINFNNTAYKVNYNNYMDFNLKIQNEFIFNIVNNYNKNEEEIKNLETKIKDIARDMENVEYIENLKANANTKKLKKNIKNTIKKYKNLFKEYNKLYKKYDKLFTEKEKFISIENYSIKDINFINIIKELSNKRLVIAEPYITIGEVYKIPEIKTFNLPQGIEKKTSFISRVRNMFANRNNLKNKSF